MLKWFRANTTSPRQKQQRQLRPDLVTDDPLATIRVDRPVDRRRQEIYAVSRVNPLFHDADDQKTSKTKSSTRGKRHEHSPEPTGKSGSSGYESNLYNSSSEYSSGGAYSGGTSTIYGVVDCQKTTVLREDAITVLEQNVGFVKSILVAVRGGGGSTKKKHSRKPSGGSSSATLSPIPEGKVDYCIPRPVWPPRDDDSHVYVTPSSLDPYVDDAVLLYTRLAYAPALPIPRVGGVKSASATSQHGSLKNSLSQSVDGRRDSASESMLRELSHTINQALEGNQLISHEELLKSLSRTINRNLDSFNNSSASTSSEDALKRFSFTLSQSDPLARMARALSNSSGSSGGSSLRADGRRLLKRSGVMGAGGPKAVPSPPGTSSSDSEPVARSSSSSAASSSGFYDSLNTTPSCSSSGRHSSGVGGGGGGGVVQDLSQTPVFVHQDLTSVTNCARNALLYGTLCGRMNVASASSGNHGYEKLLPPTHASDSEDSGVKRGISEDKDASWDTYYGTGVTAGDVRLKSKSDALYHWSADRPDFTLDIPRAERLIRKIKASKKRRCWCHFMTSLVGLIFFVVSVMVVSMMVTRGKRIFGSL